MGEQVFRALTIAMLMLSLVVSSDLIFAGPLEDGEAAYNHGDYATALRLIGPLAEQGDAAAQLHLGQMYARGEGVIQDYKEAMKWYRLAALRGDAAAQTNLGSLYANGKGAPEDFKEAMKWFRLAATQGDAAAQNNLVVMYANGKGFLKTFYADICGGI